MVAQWSHTPLIVGSIPTLVTIYVGVAERPKATDCKSVTRNSLAGSNPAPLIHLFAAVV